MFSLPSLSFLRTDTPMTESNSELLLESQSQEKLVETLLLEDGISWRCFLQTQQNPHALKVPPDSDQTRDGAPCTEAFHNYASSTSPGAVTTSHGSEGTGSTSSCHRGSMCLIRQIHTNSPAGIKRNPFPGEGTGGGTGERNDRGAAPHPGHPRTPLSELA